jgi:hypothetical protein
LLVRRKPDNTRDRYNRMRWKAFRDVRLDGIKNEILLKFVLSVKKLNFSTPPLILQKVLYQAFNTQLTIEYLTKGSII